ncbi:LOW QUALITY PROTEIN: uncharacterized protein LOC121380885 [Gigantopelta aegis]|uniref:LOW QUALITY PROTEIN: uncharacterized protein LOC121380885 n=1 Tax=Gigantopelta aegis TaxID=1735272 RepID=UPI001B88CEC7|nr:LOW QUALITY PROTEIN: uncharacterized protein LOC121380885 [Gigantopelta aegis]
MGRTGDTMGKKEKKPASGVSRLPKKICLKTKKCLPVKGGSSSNSLNEEHDHQIQSVTEQKKGKQPHTKQPESKAKQIPPVKVPQIETKVVNVGKESVYGHHINQQKVRQPRTERGIERYPADLETFGHRQPGHVEPVYVRQGRQVGRVPHGNVYNPVYSEREPVYVKHGEHGRLKSKAEFTDQEPVYVKHGSHDVIYGRPAKPERVHVQMHYMSRENFNDHETVLVRHTYPSDSAGYELPLKLDRSRTPSRYTSDSALVDVEPVYIKQRSKSGHRLVPDRHAGIERYASDNALVAGHEVLYVKHGKKGVPHAQPPPTSDPRRCEGHYASTSQREPLYTSVKNPSDYEGHRYRTRSEERGEKIYERNRLIKGGEEGDSDIYGHSSYQNRSRSQERDSEIYDKTRQHIIDGSVQVHESSRHSTANKVGDESVYEGRNVRASSAEKEQDYDSRIYEASIPDRDDVLSASNDTLSSDMESQSSRRGRKPRRHTVTVGAGPETNEEEKEKKRAAFMEMLAQRYPEYAEKISGHYSDSGYHSKPRTREHQRRRTTIVTYEPDHNRSAEYDSGTVSDMDVPSGFTRGGFMRSSLPIVRSASLSFERPLGDTLGLVFLVYGDETKKALLPNEITTLDTVQALFVRSFPEKLSMDYFKSTKKKIYVLEPKSNIFFQLEDLRDIRDRTVLKVHECDSQEPQKVKDIQPVRGRTIQLAKSRPPPKPAHTLVDDQADRDKYARSQSLPPHIPHGYQGLMEEQRVQWEAEQRSRSQTPDPQRPHTLPMTQQRPKVSPDRLPTPERLQLGTIPEHHLMKNGFPEQAVNGYYEPGPGYHRDPRLLTASPTGSSRTFSPQPGVPIYETPYGYHQQAPGAPPQTYVAHSVRANTVHVPQRATTVPPTDPRHVSRNSSSNRHSLSFAPMSTSAGVPPTLDPNYQRSASYRVTPEREIPREVPRSRSITPQPGDFETKYTPPIKRIDQMEAQLASLTAWVHKSVVDKPDRGIDGMKSGSTSDGDSYSTSSTLDVERTVVVTGMSDIPVSSTDPSVVISKEMRACMLAIKRKTAELRADLRSLKRMHQFNRESLADSMYDTARQIKDVLSSVPSANCQVVRQHRSDMDEHQQLYTESRSRIGKELSDLEANVEELRSDVISRQCRVNMSDVEGMALVLSNITKALAELKGNFPALQENLKQVMAGEMEIVVTEEKFLKEEPERIETELKRCKKLTGTLYTLKRLASVQEHRCPQVPAIAMSSLEPTEDDKQLVLENIRAVVPDHDSRLQRLEAAESSRERKKKIVGQQEALKMGKTLELATKALKPMTDGSGTGSSTENIAETQPDGHSKVTHPTEKISNVRKGESNEDVVYEVIDSKDGKRDPGAGLHDSKEAARSAFFNALSPPVSPRDPALHKTTMDYTVRISPAKNVTSSSTNVVYTTSMAPTPVTSSSDLKPNNLSIATDKKGNLEGGIAQSNDISPTRAKSAFSSIPQRSGKPSSSLTPAAGSHGRISPSQPGKKDDAKQKKIPPPPPPRKSSRLPTSSVMTSMPVSSQGVVTGPFMSPVCPVSPKTSPTSDGAKSVARDKNVPLNPQVKIAARTGPVSSTPKPTPPKKPTTKFEKDLVAGIYANMNRPDLQHQRISAGSIIRKTAEETASQGAATPSREERGSSSDSTSSSTSLDSQQGAVNVGKPRSESLTDGVKRPKPPPPERRSSLQQKSHIEMQDAAMSTSGETIPSPAKCLFADVAGSEVNKTRLLQEQQKKLEHIVSETNEMIKQQQKLNESKNPVNGSAGKSKS